MNSNNYKYKYINAKKDYFELQKSIILNLQRGGIGELRDISIINLENVYEDGKIKEKISSTNQYQEQLPYKSPYLYKGEPRNIEGACHDDGPEPKNIGVYRFMIFNVHNFVKMCGELDEVKRNYLHALNFIQDKNVDFLLMTDMTSVKDEEQPIEAGNFYPIIEKISQFGLKENFIARTHYLPGSVPKYYFLANGVFGNTLLINKRTFNIGSNRILIECIIQIDDQIVLLYVTHVEEDYSRNPERFKNNISNIASTIKQSMNDYGIQNVILGGDMNYPHGLIDINKIERDRLTAIVGKEEALIMRPIQMKNLFVELDEFLTYIKPLNATEVKFTGFNKREIIDHFYISREIGHNFEVTSKILRSSASDHYPVILDIKKIN